MILCLAPMTLPSAGILHVNQALTSLNLYQNQAITDVGIDALIAALNANDVLTELDCSGANKVTLPALKALEAAVLMNRYPLALKRAIPLIRANAPTLRRLDLRPPVEDTPRAKRATLDDSACAVLASALRSNVYITALDLSGCGITSYGVQHIADYLRECAVLHRFCGSRLGGLRSYELYSAGPFINHRPFLLLLGGGYRRAPRRSRTDI